MIFGGINFMTDPVKTNARISKKRFLDTFISVEDTEKQAERRNETMYKNFKLIGDGDILLGRVDDFKLEMVGSPSDPQPITIHGILMQREPNIPEVVRKYASTLPPANLTYKKIIYSNGVTTVIWADGTKTTVRAAEGEETNPGAGIAYAFMKKALGNKNAHNKILRKEVPAMLAAEEARIQKKKLKRN